MDSNEEIRRLMEGLASDVPVAADRMDAVLARAARTRKRVLVAAGAGTALAGLALALVLVVPGGDGVRDDLVASDPTSTATAEPSPTPRPTTSETTAPRPSASAAAVTSPPPPRIDVSYRALLDDSYVERAFGGGRPSRVASTSAVIPGMIRSCYHAVDGVQKPTDLVARSWYWPGEVVVSQVLARETSARVATDRFATCSDPTARDFDHDADGYASDGGDPVVRSLDVGDGGYVITVPRSLDTSVYAGARLGSSLVVLTWRQSGPVGATEPLEQALSAALSKATGGTEGAPPVADAPRFPEALKGFLTLAELPRPLPWTHDSQENSAELRCGDALVPTTAAPVARTWEATSDGIAVPTPAITISFAKASDTTTATAGFAACKQGWSQKGAVDDPPEGGAGDESFLYAADPNVTLLIVRSGSSYLTVRYATAAYDETKAIALAALGSFEAAGRLS